jgi:hypothetical protein
VQAPVDIVEVDLVRRQGDVSGTLMYLAPNGQPANIGGWTFTFSCQPAANLLTASSTTPVGNSNGAPMTTVTGLGFTVPPYNSTQSINVVATAGINAGDFLYMPVLGVVQAKAIINNTTLIIYNNGFPGNAASGSINPGTNVWEASNVGYAVLVVPPTITNWNNGNSVGRFPYFIKYSTNDPSPGPYIKTFYQGNLWIMPQNDP